MLAEFIKNEITLPFVLSHSDCCGMANRWVKQWFGVDCFKNSSIEYSTEDQTHEVTHGDLIRFLDGVCRENGALITKTPKDGDIALIKVYDHGIPTATAAIRYKDGWFSHLESGCCFFKKVKVIRAYSWERV